MELNVWTSSKVIDTKLDPTTGRWTVISVADHIIQSPKLLAMGTFWVQNAVRNGDLAAGRSSVRIVQLLPIRVGCVGDIRAEMELARLRGSVEQIKMCSQSLCRRLRYTIVNVLYL